MIFLRLIKSAFTNSFFFSSFSIFKCGPFQTTFKFLVPAVAASIDLTTIDIFQNLCIILCNAKGQLLSPSYFLKFGIERVISQHEQCNDEATMSP